MRGVDKRKCGTFRLICLIKITLRDDTCQHITSVGCCRSCENEIDDQSLTERDDFGEQTQRWGLEFRRFPQVAIKAPKRSERTSGRGATDHPMSWTSRWFSACKDSHREKYIRYRYVRSVPFRYAEVLTRSLWGMHPEKKAESLNDRAAR